MDKNDAESAKDRPLPGHETQSDEMACPQCGRFVGAANKCPYCGAKVEKRMSLVALRWAAVLLSTVGLVLLYLMARTREPERIRIGDIETTMNFGVVRLAGRVVADPRPFKNGNGMSFMVGDGSGELRVFVDQSQRKAMVDAGLVPRKGDEIDFVAQLQASSAGNSARIRGLNPDSFALVRDGAPVAPSAPLSFPGPGSATPPPPAAGAAAVPSPAPVAAPARDFGPVVPFSKVDGSLVGRTVVLEGTVASVKEPAPGTKQPYVMTLASGDDSLEVKFWDDQYLQIADPKSLPGAAVRVKAAVKLFHGKVDLTLKNGADLQRAVPPTAPKKARRPAVPVVEVTEAAVDSYVTVEGSIAEPSDRAGKGTAYTLTDASGSIMVVFWNNTVEPELQRKAAAAKRVRVNGKVKEFQGTLQVTPGADGLEIVE